ncbi:tetratricopeptide repeat protein [Streptomyces sp. NBC_00299]|uniref:tetratricopeptide repeat protein n=1 Tax=Streptomyces sp. NBC_00299 TaxID=2975705 RepID=UPI002E2B5412|nr:tetratricopeptide repeat protein [Streptomyces sp. NBC_00299]
MSRLSRAMKREQKRAAAIAAPMAAPIDVRVPAGGPGEGGASIGGVPVTAVAGEEIQQTVLTHLQRIAVAAGHSVHATIHDERIGYVVPLRVEADGSSHFTAEPVRTPPAPPTPPASPSESPVPAEAVRPPADPPAPSAPSAPSASRPAPPAAPPAAPPVPPAPPASLPSDQAPHRDRPTHVLRPLRDPAREASPTFSLRALPEPVGDGDAVPGTVPPPLGEFGPPPSMDAWPEPVDLPAPTPAAASTPTPARVVPDPTPELDSKPTPPRGFDAVAEAVLGDAPPATTADASPFAEQMVQVNEAVKEGRTTEATELAERTVAQASAVLGLEHPEVLGMRELAAYIAYLGGDPERAFALALDVARTHHRTRDAEAAYGSLHGAATAWRAVRDPALGLGLGRDLLALWDELMAEGGPAAEEAEELESARARMDRLTARAAKSTEPPAG